MKSVLLSALAFMIATAPAAAQDGASTEVRGLASDASSRVSVSVDFDTRWRLDDGYRIFDLSRTEAAPGLSAGYDLLRVGRRFTFAAAVGWQREAASNAVTSAGRANADFPTHVTFVADDFYAAGIGRFALRSWLDATARVGGGATRARLALETADGTFADRTWGAFASAGAGVRVHTSTLGVGALPAMRFGLALAIEGGFVAGAPLSFSLADDGADKLASAPIPVGDLARAQPYLRVAVTARF